MVGLIFAALVSVVWCVFATTVAPGTRLAGPTDKALRAHGHRALPPPLGGVGVFAGVHVGLFIEGLADPGLILASAMVLALGLGDDYLELSPLLRLVVEAAAGVALFVWGGLPGSGWLGLLVVVVMVLVVVNAVNLFDGLDGLVGLASVISALGLGALAQMRGESPWVGLILAVTLGGFLIFNWYPARIFLGDNGAYVTGIFLVYALLAGSPTGDGPDVVVGVAVLGVFLLDLAATLLRRALSHRPLFVGDRSHIYDRLRMRGWRTPLVAVAAAAVQFLFAALAVALQSAGVGWWSLAALSSTFLMFFGVLWVTGLFQIDPA